MTFKTMRAKPLIIGIVGLVFAGLLLYYYLAAPRSTIQNEQTPTPIAATSTPAKPVPKSQPGTVVTSSGANSGQNISQGASSSNNVDGGKNQ